MARDQSDIDPDLEAAIRDIVRDELPASGGGPSRRSVLKALGIAGVGTASLTAATGSASAAAGQVGTASARLDVFGDAIDTTTLTVGAGKTISDSDVLGTPSVVTQQRVDYDSGLSTYLISRLPGVSGTQYEPVYLGCDVIGQTTTDTDITVEIEYPGGTNPSVNGDEFLDTTDAALPITLADGEDLDVLLTTSAAVSNVTWTVKYREV
jgi:hypothetical protein